MTTQSVMAPPDAPSATSPLWQLQLGMAVCIGLACLVGLLSRPIGYMAALWPANAIMLGLLLRHPQLGRSLSTWVLALATYIVMDWLSGAQTFVVLAFNAANVLGVFGAWLYLIRQSPEVLGFQRQRSVMVLFIGCIVGSLACTVAGAWASSVAFGMPLLRAALLWVSGEFFNYILFLPIFLAAPRGWIWQWQWPKRQQLPNPWPLAALVINELLSILIGGPGAIAFLVPAMVWAAMNYSVFAITLLSALVCFGQTAIIAMGAFSFTPDHVMDAVSYRSGLAMLSLAPLAVACAYVLRMQALHRLNHAVNHDFLTGVLARRALMERGQKLLTRLAEEGQSIAVLMVDMDHFKQINDRYGHAQGDAVLQAFALQAHKALRPEDLVGRMGGEEFAIVLPRTTHEQALRVAQRLCELMRQQVFQVNPQQEIRITISIGLYAAAESVPSDSLEALLSRADQALYRAKNSGRNQVQSYDASLELVDV